MSNRNHQVTLVNYAECVEQQVYFLHEQRGSSRTRTDVDPAMLVEAVRDNYNNGVSVDATADDLYHRGF